MNGIGEIESINAWHSSPEYRALSDRISESKQSHGQPYADSRAGEAFTLDGNVKVYADGSRVAL